jgi:hypothetical protein
MNLTNSVKFTDTIHNNLEKFVVSQINDHSKVPRSVLAIINIEEDEHAITENPVNKHPLSRKNPQ